MQQYHGTEPPAVKGGRAIKLIRRTFFIAVAALIAGVVIYASTLPSVQKQFSGRKARMLAAGPVPVTVVEAQRKDVPLYLEGVGTAKARSTVTVRPQVDGRIVGIEFKEGQEVKRGDALARIDPSTYQAQLDQTIAKKALDEAELANARRDLDRYSQLASDIIARKTVDTQRALVEKLTAQIKVDDAAIANARAFLDYTTIVSPIDGRTGIRMVDVGNLVRASDAGIVVITELRPVSVLFTLPQQQLAQVHKAQAQGPLAVQALGPDGKELDRGTLQVVDNQVDQATGTVRMKAEFPNANLQLWPGQFVNVRLHVDTLEKVVVVPTPAVQRGPGGSAFVYVLLADERVKQQPVVVAHQTETEAVIAEGVTAADRIVTTGFSRLKDGTSVSLPAPAGEPPAARAPTAPAPASQAEPRGGLRAACAADIEKLCANVERGRGAIRACLQSNAAKLSESCKAATAGAEERPRKGAMRKAEGNATE
jgi:multidrug efflux system membrane fusion protein